MSDNTERLIAELHAAAGDSPDDADWMEDLCNRAASALRTVVAARAADAEEIERLRSDRLVAGRGLNGAAEELRLASVENAELAQQITAVRALADGITYSASTGDIRRDLDAILDLSPVTPESRARLTARNLPQRSQHDFDIATGRPLGPGATPESETNR